MLNFRNTNIFFIALLAILIGVHVKYGLPIFTYCLLLIAYSLIVFWGCYYIGSNFFIKIVCKANTDKNEIAISFDDGPAENYTQQILAILNTENVKATFFCIGNRIAGNEAVGISLATTVIPIIFGLICIQPKKYRTI
jgi:peptidoglycan-N-acetylglucosamine deacetylase